MCVINDFLILILTVVLSTGATLYCTVQYGTHETVVYRYCTYCRTVHYYLRDTTSIIYVRDTPRGPFTGYHAGSIYTITPRGGSIYTITPRGGSIYAIHRGVGPFTRYTAGWVHFLRDTPRGGSI